MAGFRALVTYREHLLQAVVMHAKEVVLSHDMPGAHAQRINISPCTHLPHPTLQLCNKPPVPLQPFPTQASRSNASGHRNALACRIHLRFFHVTSRPWICTRPMHAQAVGTKGEDLGAGLHIPHIAHAIHSTHAPHPLLGQCIQPAQHLLAEHCLIVALIQAQVMQALHASAEGSAISSLRQHADT